MKRKRETNDRKTSVIHIIWSLSLWAKSSFLNYEKNMQVGAELALSDKWMGKTFSAQLLPSYCLSCIAACANKRLTVVCMSSLDTSVLLRLSEI
jgi:hypothetical protein